MPASVMELPEVKERAQELLNERLNSNYRFTDNIFAFIMLLQYGGVIIASIALSPLTYVGENSLIHPHVWTAVLLGGLIAAPVWLVRTTAQGTLLSRMTIAVCQMLMSALIIHITGGRIESHFHVFGSLAFLAFYRDWRVLVPATLVVLLHHVAGGVYFPESTYGLKGGVELRFIEHAAWVVFENAFLVTSIQRSVTEMRELSLRQATTESTNDMIEGIVVARTKALQQSEEQTRLVIENALDGIVVIDQEGAIQRINEAGCGILGMDADSAINQRFEEFLPCLDVEHDRDSRRTVELKQFDGTMIPVEVTFTTIHGGENGATVFLRDLREQRKMQTKLAHAEKMETIGQLSAGIAHEINTPNQYIGDNMTFLKECTDTLSRTIEEYRNLIEKEAPDLGDKREAIDRRNDLGFYLDEAPRALEQGHEGVQRVQEIIRAMKDFAHPGLDNWTMVDVNRVVDSMITVSRSEWKYIASLELDLEQNLPTIQGHPGELSRVVLNIIMNAAHAMRDRFGDQNMGVISISTKSEEDQIVIEISDNGPGIPQEIREKIWQPFFTTKGVGIGTGQGLAISRSVIDRHHGGIDLKSEIGVGTTFTISLPVAGQTTQAQAA